jgi:hypothetical protein
MKSIYNPEDNTQIIERIQKLTPESKALWGKMSVDQMMSHCIAPIDVAFGNLELKTNAIMALLGRMLKNKVINAPEFKKDSPTAPAFIRKEHYNFNATQTELIEKVKKFTEGTQVIKSNKHPFFGEMSYEDWDKLHWKHLDHHLKQFNV